MREKLIELIQDAVGGCSKYWASVIAGYLLANGVTITTRCKDCNKEWCYLRQELGPEGFCSAGERKDNGNSRDR